MKIVTLGNFAFIIFFIKLTTDFGLDLIGPILHPADHGVN